VHFSSASRSIFTPDAVVVTAPMSAGYVCRSMRRRTELPHLAGSGIPSLLTPRWSIESESYDIYRLHRPRTSAGCKSQICYEVHLGPRTKKQQRGILLIAHLRSKVEAGAKQAGVLDFDIYVIWRSYGCAAFSSGQAVFLQGNM
jgi:hypothetical protein